MLNFAKFSRNLNSVANFPFLLVLLESIGFYKLYSTWINFVKDFLNIFHCSTSRMLRNRASLNPLHTLYVCKSLKYYRAANYIHIRIWIRGSDYTMLVWRENNTPIFWRMLNSPLQIALSIFSLWLSVENCRVL